MWHYLLAQKIGPLFFSMGVQSSPCIHGVILTVDLWLFTASLAVYTKQINFKPQTFQKVILTKYI